VTTLDAWQEADLLIRQHGENAELEAARLADLMLGRGDKAGSQKWEFIRQYIEATRVTAALRPHMSGLSSARPVSSEEGEIIAVAERMKQDLLTAIAAQQIVRPAVSDNGLIECFNLGDAGSAFDLVRHSLLFWQVMALMRIWDATENVYSIIGLVRLFSNPNLVEKLVERERQASHEIRKSETTLGERTTELSFSAERATPELREQQLRAGVQGWLAEANKVKGRAETARLRNYRNKILAHSAAWSSNKAVRLANYGDERKLLEMTIRVVAEGYRLATGIDYDFSAANTVWVLAQADMWGIVRSAARGERYSPAPRNINDEAERELAGGGSIAIRGRRAASAGPNFGPKRPVTG
jgi:hypothetical protein